MRHSGIRTKSSIRYFVTNAHKTEGTTAPLAQLFASPFAGT
jgi:hypothetical protein